MGLAVVEVGETKGGEKEAQLSHCPSDFCKWPSTRSELKGSLEKASYNFCSASQSRQEMILLLFVASPGVEMGTPVLHAAPAHAVGTFILPEAGATAHEAAVVCKPLR